MKFPLLILDIYEHFLSIQRFDSISSLSASRRSRVLLSQAVAELARATATASALQLAEGLIAFNETAEWAMNRLQADLVETERALGNSDWLTGKCLVFFVFDYFQVIYV